VQGYDEEGWKSLGAQMRDGEAVKIKAKLPINVSALWIAIVAERRTAAAIAIASGETLAATTSAGLRESCSEDGGKRTRGSNGGRGRKRT